MKELYVNAEEEHMSHMLLPETACMEDDLLVVQPGLLWRELYGQDAKILYDYDGGVSMIDTGDEYIHLRLDLANESYMLGLQDGLLAAQH